MFGFGKKKEKKLVISEEYIDLKETIWSLQSIAHSLQETADQFGDRLEDLREIQKATPGYLDRWEK